MPFVNVHWYEGRSDEQKAEIAKRIEDALVEVANDPEIDAVWLARGGYGACRVAEYAIPRFNEHASAKKWLGYSDAGFLLAGLGISVLTEFVIACCMQDGKLVRILPEWTSLPVEINAVYPARQNLPPRLSLFLDHLARSMAPPRACARRGWTRRRFWLGRVWPALPSVWVRSLLSGT